MKSVILCEGSDDLWFIAYYLHKTAGWNNGVSEQEKWKNYRILSQRKGQKVEYLGNGSHSVAIWCVGGKDCFSAAVALIFEKFIEDFPFDPIESVVLVRDRDNDSIETVLTTMQSWFPMEVTLKNKVPFAWTKKIEGCTVKVDITPVVIPFSQVGAIETLLLECLAAKGSAEHSIVESADDYIMRLQSFPTVKLKYFAHERHVLKAKFSATIAAVNPGHSTAVFQDMVMDCPWEDSQYVKEHFDIILNALYP